MIFSSVYHTPLSQQQLAAVLQTKTLGWPRVKNKKELYGKLSGGRFSLLRYQFLSPAQFYAKATTEESGTRLEGYFFPYRRVAVFSCLIVAGILATAVVSFWPIGPHLHDFLLAALSALAAGVTCMVCFWLAGVLHTKAKKQLLEFMQTQLQMTPVPK